MHTITQTADKRARRTLSVTELQEALGIGRSLAYELANGERLVNGRKLKAIRVGRALRIPASELEAVLGRGA